DISWGRVNHPSEHFTVGDEVEVVVLKFDPETERVSLGYKQRSDCPWTLVDKKYPIGSRVHGRVVSLVDYGAFVEIEEGVEGLIHVREMSWTKKVVNPAKILEVGHEGDGRRVHRRSGGESDRIRRLRRYHRRHRRPHPRLRHELDEARQAPQRSAQE